MLIKRAVDAVDEDVSGGGSLGADSVGADSGTSSAGAFPLLGISLLAQAFH